MPGGLRPCRLAVAESASSPVAHRARIPSAPVRRYRRSCRQRLFAPAFYESPSPDCFDCGSTSFAVCVGDAPELVGSVSSFTLRTWIPSAPVRPGRGGLEGHLSLSLSSINISDHTCHPLDLRGAAGMRHTSCSSATFPFLRVINGNAYSMLSSTASGRC